MRKVGSGMGIWGLGVDYQICGAGAGEEDGKKGNRVG